MPNPLMNNNFTTSFTQSNINNNNPQINQIENVMNQLRNMQNPMDYVNNLLRQNPQLQNLINMNRGRNPRDFLIELAKSNGANNETLQYISNLLR